MVQTKVSTCNHCGELFFKRVHNQRYCDAVCQEWHRNEMDVIKNAIKNQIGMRLTCPECGNQFNKAYHHQVYCCPEHRNKYRHARYYNEVRREKRSRV